jgi:hypothetical protein
MGCGSLPSEAITKCKNDISSYELGRSIGVTQKTAWHMLHRIRLAMQTGSFSKMTGEVEADETFIGGLAKNMHKHKREKAITGTGGAGKTVVIGILQRSRGENPSRIRAGVIANPAVLFCTAPSAIQSPQDQPSIPMPTMPIGASPATLTKWSITRLNT